MRILKRIIMGIFNNFDQYVAKKDALKHLLSHLFLLVHIYLRVRIIFAAIENIHLLHLSFQTSAVSHSIYGTKILQNNFVDFAVYIWFDAFSAPSHPQNTMRNG